MECRHSCKHNLNPTYFRPDAVGEKLCSQVVLWLSIVDVGLGEETGLPAAALLCFLVESLYSLHSFCLL